MLTYLQTLLFIFDFPWMFSAFLWARITSKYCLWTAFLSEYKFLENFPVSYPKGKNKRIYQSNLPVCQSAFLSSLSLQPGPLWLSKKRPKLKLIQSYTLNSGAVYTVDRSSAMNLLQQAEREAFSTQHPQSCTSSGLGLSRPPSTQASILEKDPQATCRWWFSLNHIQTQSDTDLHVSSFVFKHSLLL